MCCLQSQQPEAASSASLLAFMLGSALAMRPWSLPTQGDCGSDTSSGLQRTSNMQNVGRGASTPSIGAWNLSMPTPPHFEEQKSSKWHIATHFHKTVHVVIAEHLGKNRRNYHPHARLPGSAGIKTAAAWNWNRPWPLWKKTLESNAWYISKFVRTVSSGTARNWSFPCFLNAIHGQGIKNMDCTVVLTYLIFCSCLNTPPSCHSSKICSCTLSNQNQHKQHARTITQPCQAHKAHTQIHTRYPSPPVPLGRHKGGKCVVWTQWIRAGHGARFLPEVLGCADAAAVKLENAVSLNWRFHWWRHVPRCRWCCLSRASPNILQYSPTWTGLLCRLAWDPGRGIWQNSKEWHFSLLDSKPKTALGSMESKTSQASSGQLEWTQNGWRKLITIGRP